MRMLLSPSGLQTASPLDGGATGLYFDWGELAGWQRPSANRVVLLGLGGGEMLRAARRKLPDADLIGVEVDPLVAQAAVDSFRVRDFGVTVIVADAAVWLQLAPSGSIDVLMVDVFVDSTMPPYFRSPGFFRECKRVLTPSGAVLQNVWPAAFAHSVAKAMRRAGFEAVTAINVPHANAMLWSSSMSNENMPPWLGIDRRYTP
jgi:spermidine synthase